MSIPIHDYGSRELMVSNTVSKEVHVTALIVLLELQGAQCLTSTKGLLNKRRCLKTFTIQSWYGDANLILHYGRPPFSLLERKRFFFRTISEKFISHLFNLHTRLHVQSNYIIFHICVWDALHLDQPYYNPLILVLSNDQRKNSTSWLQHVEL